MSMSKVAVVEGTMSPFNITMNIFGQNIVVPFGNYNYALVSDPDFWKKYPSPQMMEAMKRIRSAR